MTKQRSISEQTEEERLQTGRLFGIVIPAYINHRRNMQVAVKNAKKNNGKNGTMKGAKKAKEKTRLMNRK